MFFSKKQVKKNPTATGQANDQQQKKEFNIVQELFDWAESLVTSLVIIVLLFAFAFRLIGVSGDSMKPTLHNMDYLIVSKLGYTPEQGDIVVLTKEGFLVNEITGKSDSFVKRIIATEGQTVDIDFGAGIVYVDGVPLDEPYIPEPTWLDEGVQFPLTVPEGGIFVMGDNRNNSKDSRHTDLGPVDTRHVIGKAVFLAIPGKSAELDRVEWNRIGFLN